MDVTHRHGICTAICQTNLNTSITRKYGGQGKEDRHNNSDPHVAGFEPICNPKDGISPPQTSTQSEMWKTVGVATH